MSKTQTSKASPAREREIRKTPPSRTSLRREASERLSRFEHPKLDTHYIARAFGPSQRPVQRSVCSAAAGGAIYGDYRTTSSACCGKFELPERYLCSPAEGPTPFRDILRQAACALTARPSDWPAQEHALADRLAEQIAKAVRKPIVKADSPRSKPRTVRLPCVPSKLIACGGSDRPSGASPHGPATDASA